MSILSLPQCFPAEDEAVLHLTQYWSLRPFSQSFSQCGHWTVSEFDRKISCSSTFCQSNLYYGFILAVYSGSCCFYYLNALIIWPCLLYLSKCYAWALTLINTWGFLYRITLKSISIQTFFFFMFITWSVLIAFLI